MSEESENSREEPRVSDSLNTRRTNSNQISNSPASRLLSNFLQVMNITGTNAQSVYDRALVGLRERPEEVIIEIARAMNGCDPTDYPQQWALIHAAVELRHRAVLPLLRSIVLTPIPPEESPNPHSFSTVAEETILRTTAVEGIEYLAVNGDQTAIDSLLEFLSLPSLSIRRAAIQGILATKDGQQLRGQMAERLPRDQQFLLDIKRVTVRDVPQVRDPDEGIGKGKTTPAPRLPDEPEGDAPTTYKR